MCGITGIIDTRGVDKDLLMRMTNSLVHRGPDDGDIYVDDIVGLGHRRLAILDLSPSGKQPMISYDGKAVIIFNGEIYNFLELREVLLDKGHKFSTKTDTEVLLAAYNEWGSKCLQKLNGMFAFAIYDKRKKQIFLARDPIGKKPLYYHIHSNGLIFASEIKALLQYKELSKELDVTSLWRYFTWGYIDGEFCIFRQIKKLPPATAMLYDLGNLSTVLWKYWHLPEVPNYISDENVLLEEFSNLLLDATKMRMISDVPLGAFLSGGVDSSLIVAAMSKVGQGKVKTFSVGFPESEFNELPYAKIVAEHFGTDHHELVAEPGSLSLLPKLMKQYDEPLADTSIIPTYLISKATRDYVTVVLSGDGGDELFGGYSHHRDCFIDKVIRSILPSTFAKLAYQIGKRLPNKAKGKRFLMRLRYDLERSFVDRISNAFFKENERRALLKQEWHPQDIVCDKSPEKDLMRLFSEYQKYDFLNKICCIDFLTYLPDDVMVKVDRATMFVALESRAPLLDKRIAEFAFSKIPGRLKVNRLTSKYLLKQLAKQWLPQDLNVNRKQGFGIPIASWFRKDFSRELKEKLLESKNIYFNKEYIEKLLFEHSNGANHGMRLFAILIFILWHELYCE